MSDLVILSKKDRLTNNLKAINNLISLHLGAKTPSEDLLLFSGFGGLAEILFNPDDPDIPDNKFAGVTNRKTISEIYEKCNVLDDLYAMPRGCFLNSFKSSVNTAFYTPGLLISSVFEAIQKKGFQPKSYLDPSAGNGIFYQSLPGQWKPICVEIEKDLFSAHLLEYIHKNAKVYARPFEDFIPESYDLISSNIPFGNIRIRDVKFLSSKDNISIKSTERIHNYFIKKSIDSLNDKGLMIFIMPIGVMDSPANEFIRKHLATKGNIVNIFRLPNNTFIQVGTEVTSDLIIYQKDNNKTQLTDDDKAFINGYSVLSDQEKTVNFNAYYERHPENMLGKTFIKGLYGDSFDLAPFNENFSDNLAQTISAITNQINTANIQIVSSSETIYQKHPQNINTRKKGAKQLSNALQLNLWENIVDESIVLKNLEQQAQKSIITEADPNNPLAYYNGALHRHENILGTISVNLNEENKFTLNPLKLRAEDFNLVKDFIELKNTYFKLVHLQSSSPEKVVEDTRQELNRLYDDFTGRYGTLHQHTSILAQFEKRINTLLAIEEPTETKGSFIKSEIFLKNTFSQDRQQKEEALKIEFKNTHDIMLYVLNEYGFVDMPNIIRLSNKDQQTCFEELQEFIFKTPNEGYLLKDQYLSGDIKSKLEFIANYVETNPEDPDNEIYKINIHSLKSVLPQDILFDEIYITLGQRWIPTNIYKKFLDKVLDSDVFIEFKRGSDTFFIHRPSNDPNYHGYRISEILQYTLNGKIMKVYDSIKDGKNIRTVLNPAKTKLVQEKQEELNKQFNEFLASDPDIIKQITSFYNNKYNRIIKRNYDGSHLKLEDIQYITPYPYQKDATYMNCTNNGGYDVHWVGAGKTAVICMTAHEMKRLKISNKTCIVVLKSTISDVASEYRRLYPNARILVASDRNFDAKNREQFFSVATNGNYECVIMSHENFKAIPQDKKYSIAVINEELERLQQDLYSMKDSSDISKRQLRGLELRKEALTARIESLQHGTDDVFTFQSMGFEHLLVDEAHLYKNLSYTTRLENVAGLGNQKGSQRAFHLLVAIRSLQEKYNDDKGVTFLSGTPITNSMVEMYSILKYLRPRKLYELGLESFDAFQKQFAKITTEFELSVTGEVKQKTRLSEFCNIPELSILFSEIAHIVLEEDMAKNTKNRPKAKHEFVEVEPTLEQLRFNAAIQCAIENLHWGYLDINEKRGRFTEEDKMAKMLLAANYIDKMSLSLKMVDPIKYSDFESPKILACADNIIKHYNLTKEDQGVQLIFCDKGTPKSKEYNIYQDLKDKLIAAGIPKDEIAFIHDATTDKQRKELFAKVNAGIIRLLFGSTPKLGTGTNVQTKGVAMHMLDTLWRPSDFNQRIARLERQNNLLGMKYGLKAYIYATAKTLDSFKYNILAIKDKFIAQILKSTAGNRTLDDSILNSEDMSYNDYVARLSGDNRLIEKAKTEKKIDILNSEKRYLQRVATQQESDRIYLTNKIAETKIKLEKTSHNMELLAAIPKDEEGKHILSFKTKEGKVLSTSKEISEYLYEAGKLMLQTTVLKKLNQLIPTGCNLHQFSIVASFINDNSFATNSNFYSVQFYLKSDNSLLYTSNRGIVQTNKGVSVAIRGIYVRDALHHIHNLNETTLKDYTYYQERLNSLIKSPVKPFSSQEVLENLKLTLKELMEDLTQNPPKNPLEELKKEIYKSFQIMDREQMTNEEAQNIDLDESQFLAGEPEEEIEI